MRKGFYQILSLNGTYFIRSYEDYQGKWLLLPYQFDTKEKAEAFVAIPALVDSVDYKEDGYPEGTEHVGYYGDGANRFMGNKPKSTLQLAQESYYREHEKNQVLYKRINELEQQVAKLSTKKGALGVVFGKADKTV